jgi:acyl transferase domain-containing protein
MIILFPNGAAVDSSIIASMYATEKDERHPARIQVYTFRNADPFGIGFGLKQRPVAEHFMTVMIGTNEEAYAALKRLTAEWMGLPIPQAEPPPTVVSDPGTC